MAQRVLNGTTGNASFSTGGARLNRWRLSYQPDQLDVTGFGSVWHQRIPGMQDLSGSLIGYLTEGSASDNPGIPSGQTTLPTTAVVSLMASATSGITATVMLSNIQIDVDQNNRTGADRFSADFMNAGAAVIVTWSPT